MNRFGAKYKKQLFEQEIKENMTVVEFGSSAGFLLKEFCCKEKVGIEINDVARKAAERNGIQSVKYAEDLPDDYADIIISTSVLEHVESPLAELKKLYPKLKEGGKLVFHVPFEVSNQEYCRSEINNHLYTWNCLHIGNLFKAAGYFVYRVELIQEMWPLDYEYIYDTYDEKLFQELCMIRGKSFDERSIKIIAFK